MNLFGRKGGILFMLFLGMNLMNAQELRYVQVSTANGVLEGVVSPDGKVRTFKGIPYAAPPVDSLRWRAPQPARPWTGVRKAVDYPKRAMQGRIYNDMVFNDNGPSEDCLYLNLWMPENPPTAKLPVMVWIDGGGFIAGSSSEPRQDAGNLCKKGVMVVSLNYRFGCSVSSHIPISQKNRDTMRRATTVFWIRSLRSNGSRKTLPRFGGDPDNVTIFGESAGSFSVSALMASPLAKGLLNRAIGESGAFFSSTLPMKPRAEAEMAGLKFAQSAFGMSSLQSLRAIPAQRLLDEALKVPAETFSPDVDGYFLRESCPSTFAAGRQSHVPLLAGWNLDEGNFESFFGSDKPTVENFGVRANAIFGDNAKTFLKLYPAMTDSQAKRAAQDFAGDKFIA